MCRSKRERSRSTSSPTPPLVEGAQVAERARQVPAEREVQRALAVGDGERGFDLGAIGRTRKELEDRVEVAAEERLVLRRSEQLALARAQARVPVGEVARRRQQDHGASACCAPAEEKPQRGLGIRESFLDGVSHHAILAACQLHPAGRLQRPDDLQRRRRARRADPRPSARRAGRRAARSRRAAPPGSRAAVLAAPWDSSELSRTASSRRRTSARHSRNASSRA